MVPCQHIADYYQHLWNKHKCIGWNLLRLGYKEWAKGTPKDWNNLYDKSSCFTQG